MRKALALVAVAALTAGVAGTSTAAVKKPKPKPLPKSAPVVITDNGGDANGINDQGGLLPANPEQSTPQGQRAAADILKVTFARTDDGKAVTGMSVTLSLAAPPDRGTFYRVTSSVPACSTFWFQYGVDLAASAYDGNLRHNCAGDGGGPVPATVNQSIPTVVKGNDITWTLPVKLFPAGVKLGHLISDIAVETRGYVQATAPVIDQVTTDKAYKIGQ